jgi:hypothetical protein
MSLASGLLWIALLCYFVFPPVPGILIDSVRHWNPHSGFRDSLHEFMLYGVLLAMAIGIFANAFLALHRLFSVLRNRRVETKLEGTDAQIAIRKYRKGAMISESVFPRDKLVAVLVFDRDRTFGRMRKSVALYVDHHMEELVRLLDDAKADALVAEIRRHAFVEDSGS